MLQNFVAELIILLSVNPRYGEGGESKPPDTRKRYETRDDERHGAGTTPIGRKERALGMAWYLSTLRGKIMEKDYDNGEKKPHILLVRLQSADIFQLDISLKLLF